MRNTSRLRVCAALWVVFCVGLGAERASAQRLGVTGSYLDNTLTFFDLTTRTVVATVPSGGRSPFGLAVTPDGNTLLVANVRSNDVTFFDTSTMPPVPLGPPLAIPSPCPVGGVTVTPGGQFAVTTHIACAPPAKVSVIDVAARTVASQFEVLGLEAFDAAITADGGTVILNGYDYWSTLRLSPTGVLSGPHVYISGLGPRAKNSIALTPNGARAIVPDLQSDTVSVLAIDAAGTVTFTGVSIPIGRAPSGVAVAPDGRHAYVANGLDGNLAVLSLTRPVAATKGRNWRSARRCDRL